MEEEEEEEKRRALEIVFGESSPECDEENQFFSSGIHLHMQVGENITWERVEEIKGLWLCREFLSLEQQSWLLTAIEQEGWFTETSHNQAMRFGDLPEWATKLCNFVHEALSYEKFDSRVCGDSSFEDQSTEETCPLPFHLLWREPLFDQLIVNAYEPGEGICAHVDLMRFEDGIAVISLQSACVMQFTCSEQQVVDKVGTEAAAVELESPPARRIPILLTPGSLLLFSGEARYLWKHEINRKPGFQVWEGKEICQQKRTSVTLRKLCQPM